MIINASTVLLTLVLMTVFLYGGLYFIRQFALQIAQENNQAVAAMDTQAEGERRRKERAADAAAASAFAKVQPILTTPASTAPAAHQEESRSGVV
jgi:hypothetical protein